METLLFIVEAVTILSVLLSIIYTAGIVWRVEGELDTSYKFFTFSVVFFLIAEILNVYYAGDNTLVIIAKKLSMALFAVLFLIGTLCMRDIVRKLDGEK